MQEQHYFKTPNLKNSQDYKMSVFLLGQKQMVISSSQVFSCKSLDLGTKVLLEFIQKNPELLDGYKTILDLGCGWGAISLVLAKIKADAMIYGIDINKKAVYLTKKNAELFNLSNVQTYYANSNEAIDLTPDCIVSNPPVRIGKQEFRQLMQLWFSKLQKDGKFIFVIQKHLGADSMVSYLNENNIPTKKLASSKGYRILCSKKNTI